MKPTSSQIARKVIRLPRGTNPPNKNSGAEVVPKDLEPKELGAFTKATESFVAPEQPTKRGKHLGSMKPTSGQTEVVPMDLEPKDVGAEGNGDNGKKMPTVHMFFLFCISLAFEPILTLMCI